jgi:hypothetical protein
MGLEWSFQPSVELRRRPVKDFSDGFSTLLGELPLGRCGDLQAS